MTFLRIGIPLYFIILLEHDLFRKPVPTFRDHALKTQLMPSPMAQGEAPGLASKIVVGGPCLGSQFAPATATFQHVHDAADDAAIVRSLDPCTFVGRRGSIPIARYCQLAILNSQAN
jgi:hypothetical protein